jgi:lambda family phage portal protein
MRSKPLSVRLGVVDRLIGVFAPQSAAKRYAARIAVANLQRAYDGAAKDRGTGGWQTSNKAADAEIGPAAALLRDRMRDLVRNNPTAARAVSVLVNNMVGTGIRPRAKTGKKALDKRIDALWAEWSAQCDADGHTDFHGLTALAVRGMIEGGETFTIRRPRRRSDKLAVPLQFQIMEADHLDTSKNEELVGGSGRIRQGIEYDKIGRRVAYHLFPDHPGDSNPISGRSLTSVRVDAARVLHLFERQRTQSRGVPWGTPALRALRDVDDWQAAELVRKKTEACLVGIVFGADEENQSIAPKVEDGQGNEIEQFEPGLIAYARGGKDIKFNQPGSTAGVYEWHSVMLHIIAAGWRVPYELLTGDLKQVNFSSSRVGLQEFRRMVESFQWQAIIPMFCQPIWDAFIEAAFTDGKIDVAKAGVEWAPPRFESVNPLQDASTDLLEARAGFISPQQAIAKRGYDPKEVLKEWTEWAKLTDGAKLVFDSDPRLVSKGGQAQATDPLNLDPDTGEPKPNDGEGDGDDKTKPDAEQEDSKP